MGKCVPSLLSQRNHSSAAISSRWRPPEQHVFWDDTYPFFGRGNGRSIRIRRLRSCNGGHPIRLVHVSSQRLPMRGSVCQAPRFLRRWWPPGNTISSGRAVPLKIRQCCTRPLAIGWSGIKNLHHSSGSFRCIGARQSHNAPRVS